MSFVSPTFIRSPAEFAACVELKKTPESLVLEFKRELSNWRIPPGSPNAANLKREAQKEACRDITQFANTFGGCLLVGIAERLDGGSGQPVADSIDPVTAIDDLVLWIQQALKNYAVPNTITIEIVGIALPEGSILAVNVPASRAAVSVWDSHAHTIEYLHRTNHGKDWFNPEEIERHMMNGSRAARLTFQSTRARAQGNGVTVAGGVWYTKFNHPLERLPNSTVLQLTEFADDECFELECNTLGKVRIPYGVVKECWLDMNGKMNLLLSVRLVARNDVLCVELP